MKPSLSLLTTIWHCILFILNISVCALCVFLQASIESNSTGKLALQICMIVILVLLWILMEMQNVYVFFHVVRSCIYPQSYSSMLAYQKRYDFTR